MSLYEDDNGSFTMTNSFTIYEVMITTRSDESSECKVDLLIDHD